MRTIAGLVVTLAAACGGGAKSGGSGGGGDSSSCEPGRCLHDFADAIERDRAASRACYDAGTAPETAAGGRVVINFEVGADGAVVDASQAMREGQITEQAVVDCLVGVVKGVQFHPSKAGKTTRAFHTFEFAPRRTIKQ